jgi:hypothetical protein
VQAPDRSYLERCFGAEALAARPHLFATTRVPIASGDLATMAAFAEAIEAVAVHPTYRQAICPPGEWPARAWPKAASVCMGYDFHLTPEGPKLIEINTNAGGLAFVAELMNAWGMAGGALLDEAVTMFRAEWQAERESAPLQTIAIVDDDPAGQFMAPEFERFRALFLAHGIDALIADPREFSWKGGRLRHGEKTIDLVYNRLTDFALRDPAHAALAEAWLADAVVVTPHPFAHRLLADKRNLALLADPGFRADLALAPQHEAALAAVLLAIKPVRSADATALWAERKHLFFKPAGGFGGRAAYRGDRMTKRVFEEIIAAGDGAYVAQQFAAPGECEVATPEGLVVLKYDVRNYAYRGRVQAVAARLYQGQTTNMRTPGGGFAATLAA